MSEVQVKTYMTPPPPPKKGEDYISKSLYCIKTFIFITSTCTCIIIIIFVVDFELIIRELNTANFVILAVKLSTLCKDLFIKKSKMIIS